MRDSSTWRFRHHGNCGKIYSYSEALKGRSNSLRYRTESSRQMRGARETYCEYIPEPRTERKTLLFLVGCAGIQHPLSGWNKESSSLFAEAGSVSCL